MRRLAFLLLLSPCLAQADLYRWIDPESGSVKLSSQPPTDPRVNAEVLPYRAPTPPPKTPSAAAAAAKPAATPSGAPNVQALEARWRELLNQLANARPEEVVRNPSLAETYEAARAELDQLDPNGAVRRQAVATRALERLREGLAAQGGTQPKEPKK